MTDKLGRDFCLLCKRRRTVDVTGRCRPCRIKLQGTHEPVRDPLAHTLDAVGLETKEITE